MAEDENTKRRNLKKEGGGPMFLSIMECGLVYR